MSQTKVRTIGAEERRFNNIMNSRSEVNRSMTGTPVRCQVSGKPQLGYYDENITGLNGQKGVLKDIYSFNVNKASVCNSTMFTEGHAKAIALEAAGDKDEARILFDQLLNQSQLSFGIINNDGTKTQFFSGQTVDLLLDTVQVQDRDAAGNRLESTHEAIVVKSMTPVAAIVASKGRRWGADVEEVAAPAAPETKLSGIAQKTA